jgi:hypothetical protein
MKVALVTTAQLGDFPTSVLQRLLRFIAAFSRISGDRTFRQLPTERRVGLDAYCGVRGVLRSESLKYGSHRRYPVVTTITDIPRFEDSNPLPQFVMNCRVIRAKPSRPLGRYRFLNQSLNKPPHVFGYEKHPTLHIGPLGPIARLTQAQVMPSLMKWNVDRDGDCNDRADGLYPSCVRLLNRCCGGIHA